MPNHIALVGEFRRDVSSGMPTIDGPTDKVVSILNRIPYLLRRIDELESALRPISHYYEVNKNSDGPTFLINKADGQRAFDVMDVTQAFSPRPMESLPKKYEYPAR